MKTPDQINPGSSNSQEQVKTATLIKNKVLDIFDFLNKSEDQVMELQKLNFKRDYEAPHFSDTIKKGVLNKEKSFIPIEGMDEVFYSVYDAQIYSKNHIENIDESNQCDMFALEIKEQPKDRKSFMVEERTHNSTKLELVIPHKFGYITIRGAYDHREDNPDRFPSEVGPFREKLLDSDQHIEFFKNLKIEHLDIGERRIESASELTSNKGNPQSYGSNVAISENILDYFYTLPITDVANKHTPITLRFPCLRTMDYWPMTEDWSAEESVRDAQKKLQGQLKDKLNNLSIV